MKGLLRSNNGRSAFDQIAFKIIEVLSFWREVFEQTRWCNKMKCFLTEINLDDSMVASSYAIDETQII